MKKKAIEKIPYLRLRAETKKEAKYVGVTAVKNVGHEKHLFVEVYQNQEETKSVPVVRIVLTRKDFGTYIPETGEWTRKKCKGEYWDSLIWMGAGERAQTWEQIEKENVLQGSKDLERILKFTGEKHWKKECWWEYIKKRQEHIAIDAARRSEEKRYKRRQDALHERMKNVRELPKKEILEKADKIYFGDKHYLYYKKHGSWVKITCSKCGGVTDVRWKTGEAYESQLQRRIEEPREHHYGTCPMCGAMGEYKCQGKVKGAHVQKISLFLGQKYKENGMVMRYVEVGKRWVLGFTCGEKGTEMYNAYEEISGVEIARAYFEPEKKVQIDYHKHNYYSGNDFWDDCNLNGMNNIVIRDGWILPETYKELKDTMFRYSALKEYAQKVGKINPIEYLKRYQEIPQMEVLVKIGLTGIVEKLVKQYYGIVANKNARRPDEFLGIWKERVRQLIKKNGDTSLLSAMKMEKRAGQRWTDEQIEQLSETGLSESKVEQAMKYMTLQKLLNRIEKYAGCQYGGCSGAIERIHRAATTYTDYLSMRERLGYDLNNTVYQQPHNLKKAHDKMVMETNKEEMDKHIRMAEEKYPNIRKCYRNLRKKYFYEDETYMIRPARSAGEIVTEGRLLHHCVGGDGYLNSHNSGRTYILMLRFRSDPETPYITVEIDAKNPRIIQWYGERDRKPDEKNMKCWIERYLENLKNGARILEVAIA